MSVINKIQEKTTTEGSEALPVFNTRRKLIKGTAIAVPVVMTLRSGAALATASTDQCIARDQQFANDTKPSKFTNSESDSFLRTPVTIIRLIKIKEEVDGSGLNPKWVYDKKPGGDMKLRTVYVHGHALATYPTLWLNTSEPQGEFNDQGSVLDVYDSYADPLPDISGGTYFKRNLSNFVQKMDFGFREKYGLVTTFPDGTIQNDGQGPRVGRFVGHADLDDNNHITGSCWNSLNPNVP